MRQSHGSRRLFYAACWTLKLLAAAITLSAATFIAQAAEPEFRVYLVEDLVRRLHAHREYPDTHARDDLAEHLRGILTEPGMSGEALSTSLTWDGNRLIAVQTPNGHARLAEALELVRRNGLNMVSIEVAIFAGPRKEIEQMHSTWMVGEAIVEAGDQATAEACLPGEAADRPTLWTSAPVRRSRAVTSIERHHPVLFDILDEAGLSHLRAHGQDMCISRPQVMTLDGQACGIDIRGGRSVLAGMRPAQTPAGGFDLQTRRFREGHTMWCRPIVLAPDRVALECSIVYSTVRGVDGTAVLHSPAGELQFETAEVEKTRIEVSQELTSGQTLLLGGMSYTDKEGRPEAMLVTLRTTLVPSQKRWN